MAVGGVSPCRGYPRPRYAAQERKANFMIHCLFEQSGTFKNEFKKLGYDAFDYDIQNEFGETDFIVDLFQEIDAAYHDEPSIFDTFDQEDLILAFFPCTRFECKVPLEFRGEAFQMKKYTDEQKLKYSIKMHNELNRNYKLISELAIICLDRGLKCVIENPYTQPHYLTSYWCLKPKLIDMNRRENGDYMKKPTQYYFIGFEPAQNLVFESIDYVEPRTHQDMKCQDGFSRTTLRSMIHPQYANRFIRQYLVGAIT